MAGAKCSEALSVAGSFLVWGESILLYSDWACSSVLAKSGKPSAKDYTGLAGNCKAVWCFLGVFRGAAIPLFCRNDSSRGCTIRRKCLVRPNQHKVLSNERGAVRYDRQANMARYGRGGGDGYGDLVVSQRRCQEGNYLIVGRYYSRPNRAGSRPVTSEQALLLCGETTRGPFFSLQVLSTLQLKYLLYLTAQTPHFVTTSAVFAGVPRLGPSLYQLPLSLHGSAAYPVQKLHLHKVPMSWHRPGRSIRCSCEPTDGGRYHVGYNPSPWIWEA